MSDLVVIVYPAEARAEEMRQQGDLACKKSI